MKALLPLFVAAALLGSSAHAAPAHATPNRPAASHAAPAAKKAPAAGALSLAVSTQKKILVVRLGGQDVKTYDVAVGTKQKPTPMGNFTIRHIVWNPAWHPPAEKWAKGKKPTEPNDPKNPMKVVKLFFQEPDYYIHGTDQEDSLGGAASHGCIRMAQTDVYELARYVQEHAGQPQSEEWYQHVVGSDQSADLRLPIGVPIAIGK
jgi:lipoprotein-anchoring transpeptidase ErfK/SrfK